MKQIAYSLYRSNNLTKSIYNNLVNKFKMETMETTESNRLRFYFTDKLDHRGNKTNTLINLSIYYTWQNVKSECKNNKFKITAPTWDETFDLRDGSYTIADIQNYFLHIVKKLETDIITSEESPVLIYPNRIKNRIVFKIKTGYKLQMLSNATMRLLDEGPIVDTTKNGQNVPRLEQVSFALLHSNVVHNDKIQNSKLLYSFVPDKSFGQLLSVQPKALIHSRTTVFTFDYIDVWFTYQALEPLQIEDDVDITLIIQNNP